MKYAGWSAGGEERRWNCPSDRELTLRAKLNSGWSVHSGDCFKKRDQIQEPEIEWIETVIERSRQIDDVENERIRRMVSRLENMKTNAIGDGCKTCSMCRASRGFFRTAFVTCTDCWKAVCEKCRIDIQTSSQELCVLCKICAENREVWKKSGGWFYGKIPLLLNDDTQNETRSQSAILTTWEHRKPDIVRLQSFQPPETTGLFYKNWAVSSSPDLKCLDDGHSLVVPGPERHRKGSEGTGVIEMSSLRPPDVLTTRQLSVSCPSLQVSSCDEGTTDYNEGGLRKTDQNEKGVRKTDNIEDKKARKTDKRATKHFLQPARTMMEKVSKHRKSRQERRNCK